MGRNATGPKTRGSRPDYWWHDGALQQWIDGSKAKMGRKVVHARPCIFS
jgi:hypothetical protein